MRVLNLKLAREIAGKKSKEITNLGVDAVVASCPFCKMQIEDAFRLSQTPSIKVLHIAELLAMAYRIDP